MGTPDARAGGWDSVLAALCAEAQAAVRRTMLRRLRLLPRCCCGGGCCGGAACAWLGGKGNAKGQGLRLQGQKPSPQVALCSKCSSLSLSLCHSAGTGVPVASAWHYRDFPVMVGLFICPSGP